MASLNTWQCRDERIAYDEETQKIIKIQALARRKNAQKRFAKDRRSIIQLQAIARGKIVRMSLKRKQERRFEKKEMTRSDWYECTTESKDTKTNPLLPLCRTCKIREVHSVFQVLFYYHVE